MELYEKKYDLIHPVRVVDSGRFAGVMGNAGFDAAGSRPSIYSDRGRELCGVGNSGRLGVASTKKIPAAEASG